jgi:hypothetical protein
MRDYLDVIGVDGGFPLSVIEQEVRVGSLILGTMTDEEVAVIGARRPAGVDASPHMSMLGHDDRIVAAETADRLMRTTVGKVPVDPADPDNEDWQLGWIHAPIAGALEHAALCVELISDVPDRPSAQLVHVVTDSLALFEIVFPDGTHRFDFGSVDRAVQMTADESTSVDVELTRHVFRGGEWSSDEVLRGGPGRPLGRAELSRMFAIG